jgi:putative Ca2+/H+ antiporter (TMEM165/GDT1 family)
VVHVRNVIASIALTIAIGELGDKTQLATATLAAQANPVAVWVGATAGEVLAASIGAFFGSRVGARLNPKAVKLASAALFALFGVLLLVSA